MPYGAVRPDTAAHLKRFGALHSSDWYANRTLFQVCKGSAGRGTRRRDGEKFSRGVEYYSATALRFLEKWHKHSAGVPSLRARKLLPPRPSEDQLLLLGALEASSLTQMRRIIEAFEPWLLSSWNAMEAISAVTTRAERAERAAEISKHPHVTRSVKRAAKLNLSLPDLPQ